jgi:hypothetical protein
MTSNRREFVAAGIASVCALAGSGKLAAADPAAGQSPVKVLDYGRSFICNTAKFNAVRFWVESRTILTSKEGATYTFYQCGSCKSEDTFAKKDLFLKDNYDFLPIMGTGPGVGEWLIFRRRARLDPSYRQVRKFATIWGEPNVKVREADRAVLLDTYEKIRDAAAGAAPIVARTEISNAETGWSAIIEHPVKTLNVSLDKPLYQTDTGPVAFPDLSKPYTPVIECLSLAFVAFNAPNFADFVIEQPTAVVEKGQEKCQIYHYSNPISLPAKNTLWVLPE